MSGTSWTAPTPARPGWLSRLLDWQRETPDADTFWSVLTADLSGDGELTVVTEGGRTLQLPVGSSCVDVAYALGEGVGHRCIGARLNGRLAALSTVLHDGDSVDILTESGDPGGPAPGWLAHARTPAARIAIERWIAGHPEPEPEEQRLPTGPAGPLVAPPRTADPHRPDLHRPEQHRSEPHRSEPAAVRVTAVGMPDAPARLARCCTPVPPDPLIGFAIRGGAVAVHRRDCRTGAGMAQSGRPAVEVSWAGDPAPVGYRATVQADALGRPRLLADLTAAMSAIGVDIVSASVEPPQELRVRHTYTVELPDAGALPELMRVMLRVPGVYDVYRAGPQGAQERPAPRVPDGDDAPDRDGAPDRNRDDLLGAAVRPSSPSGIRGRAATLPMESTTDCPAPGGTDLRMQ